jgi:hypothetical protein
MLSRGTGKKPTGSDFLAVPFAIVDCRGGSRLGRLTQGHKLTVERIRKNGRLKIYRTVQEYSRSGQHDDTQTQHD